MGQKFQCLKGVKKNYILWKNQKKFLCFEGYDKNSNVWKDIRRIPIF